MIGQKGYKGFSKSLNAARGGWKMEREIYISIIQKVEVAPKKNKVKLLKLHCKE